MLIEELRITIFIYFTAIKCSLEFPFVINLLPEGNHYEYVILSHLVSTNVAIYERVRSPDSRQPL